MATYAIGDVQGCYRTLQSLLEKINYNPNHDILWFTGDLVNRGPDSLETLRFVKKNNAKTVLGNHDLHLLAMAHGAKRYNQDDTLQSVLDAPDKIEIINWLLTQPLLLQDDKLKFTMVHAGLAPAWDIKIAKCLADEVSELLQGPLAKTYFENMYGNLPNRWSLNLRDWDRARCITNFFTRLRYCYPDGSAEFGKENFSATMIPWYLFPNRQSQNENILFGHWAALGGITDEPHSFALDTGCVWGYTLTAMRLEDNVKFSVKNIENQ